MKNMSLRFIVFKLSQEELDAYRQRAKDIIERNFNSPRKRQRLGKLSLINRSH